jgi:hypothetical protein
MGREDLNLRYFRITVQFRSACLWKAASMESLLAITHLGCCGDLASTQILSPEESNSSERYVRAYVSYGRKKWYNLGPRRS